MKNSTLIALIVGVICALVITFKHSKVMQEKNKIEALKLKDKEADIGEVYHLNIRQIDTFERKNTFLIMVHLDAYYRVEFSILKSKKELPYVIVCYNGKPIAGMRRLHGRILSNSEMEELSQFCFGKSLEEIIQ